MYYLCIGLIIKIDYGKKLFGRFIRICYNTLFVCDGVTINHWNGVYNFIFIFLKKSLCKSIIFLIFVLLNK